MKAMMPPRFGIKVSSNYIASVVREMVDVADDLLAEVSVSLCQGSDMNFALMRATAIDAGKWLRAAESALVILDNPDWKSDLDMAGAGLQAVDRILFCLDALEGRGKSYNAQKETDPSLPDVRERCVRIVARHLDIDEESIFDHSRFIDDLGFDSLLIVELLLSAEEEFSIDIPDEHLDKIGTFGEGVEYIKGRISGRSNSEA